MMQFACSHFHLKPTTVHDLLLLKLLMFCFFKCTEKNVNMMSVGGRTKNCNTVKKKLLTNTTWPQAALLSGL